MSETLGNVSIPEITPISPSTPFPIVSDYGYGLAHDPSVVVHQFGAANAKLEQRFLLGNGAKKFTVRRAHMREADRIALRDFWEDTYGPYGSFTYNAPNDNGIGTTAYICRFANEPLSWEMLSDVISSVGVTLIEIPSTPLTYTLHKTSTRFSASDVGVVDVVNTAVTWVSGDHFVEGTSWEGAEIILTIGGTPTSYTVETVTDTSHLVLTSSAGTHSGAAYTCDALKSALLSQVQEIIPLIKIQPRATGYPAIYVSDRRCTVGGQLYFARLLGFDGISQSIGNESDQAQFTFGNADRVMRLLVNETNLFRASIEFSLFHVGTGIKLDLWKGEIADWKLDSGPEFQVTAVDGIYELTLPYPTRKISRTCWKCFKDSRGCPFTEHNTGMDTTHFPNGSTSTCDKGYDTGNGCLAHGMKHYFGGILAEPQGVLLKDNSTGTLGFGRSSITSVSIVADSIYDQVVPEVYTSGESHKDNNNQIIPGRLVNCKIAAGRAEIDFYDALGIVGEGPISMAYTGHTLDNQSNHGPGLMGLRIVSGTDPATSTYDTFALTQSGGAGGDWRKNETGGKDNFAAGLGFLELRRKDTGSLQLSYPTDHAMQAIILTGLQGWVWSGVGARDWQVLTNPIWIVVNMLLRARGLRLEANPTIAEQYFDVDAAIAAASICDQLVDVLVGIASGNCSIYTDEETGEIRFTIDGQTSYPPPGQSLTIEGDDYYIISSATSYGVLSSSPGDGEYAFTIKETQFRFTGVMQEEKPLRDWIQEVLMNCLGYYTFVFDKLKTGIRCNSSVVETFTEGNILFKSLQLTPIKPAFNHLTANFADGEFNFAANSVTVYDEDYAKFIGGATAPLFLKSNMNLSGTSRKSQAARVISTRNREELGGITAAQWKDARQLSCQTTILALNAEPGMVCSMTHSDMPAGVGEFRVLGWKLNKDYSIDIQGQTTVDEMYDLTVGPKPADVIASPVPVEYSQQGSVDNLTLTELFIQDDINPDLYHRAIKTDFAVPPVTFQAFSAGVGISAATVTPTGGSIAGAQTLYVEVCAQLAGLDGLPSQTLLVAIPAGTNNQFSFPCSLPDGHDAYVVRIGTKLGRLAEHSTVAHAGTAPVTIIITSIASLDTSSLSPNREFNHAKLSYFYSSTPNELKEAGRTQSTTEDSLTFSPDPPASADTTITVIVQSCNSNESTVYPPADCPTATLALTKDVTVPTAPTLDVRAEKLENGAIKFVVGVEPSVADIRTINHTTVQITKGDDTDFSEAESRVFEGAYANFEVVTTENKPFLFRAGSTNSYGNSAWSATETKGDYDTLPSADTSWPSPVQDLSVFSDQDDSSIEGKELVITFTRPASNWVTIFNYGIQIHSSFPFPSEVVFKTGSTPFTKGSKTLTDASADFGADDSQAGRVLFIHFTTPTSDNNLCYSALILHNTLHTLTLDAEFRHGGTRPYAIVTPSWELVTKDISLLSVLTKDALLNVQNTDSFRMVVRGLPNGTYFVRSRAVGAFGFSTWANAGSSSQIQGIKNADIRNLAITAEKMSDGAVTLPKFGSGLRPIEIVNALPAAGTLGRTVFLTTDGKLYKDDGAAWVPVVNASDMTGQIVAAQIADAAVNTAKFAAGLRPIEVVNSLPAAGTVGRVVFLTTDKKLYRDNGVTFTAEIPAADISGQIIASQIADAAISTAKFAAGITPVEIVNTLPAAGHQGRIVFLTTDNKMYRDTGSAWVCTIPTTDLVGQIVGDQIAAGTIPLTKLASGINPIDIVATLPAFGNQGRIVFLTTDNKLYRDTGTAWTAAVPAADISGTITGSQIALGTITSNKLAAGVNPVDIVDTLPAYGNHGRIVLLTTDNQIYRDTGTSWTVAVPAANLTGSVSPDRIAAGTITSVMLAAGVNPVEILATLPSPGSQGRLVFLTTDNQLYRDTGAAWTVAVPAVNISGTLGTTQIADNAVTTDKLNALAVTAAKIAAGTITATQIATNTITAGLIAAGTITATQMAAGTITATQIASATITGGLIAAGTITATNIAASTITVGLMAANSIGATQIIAASITAEKIAAATITADLIAASTILGGNIAAGTITGTNIAANTISASNIVANTITAGQIQAAAIGTNQLAAQAVTAGKIAAGTITATQMAAESIGTLQLLAVSVTAEKIAVGAITADQLAVNSVIAGKIAAGAISTTELAAGAVNASKIAAGTITAAQIAALSITGVCIAAATITGTNIAAGTITASNIASNTITAGQIQAGAISTTELAAAAVRAVNIYSATITGDKIAANTITAGNIVAGTITAAQIAAGTITGDKLVAGTISAALLSATAIDGKTITGATVQTAASGMRVVSNSAGIKLYDQNGSEYISLPTSSVKSSAFFDSISGYANGFGLSIYGGDVNGLTLMRAHYDTHYVNILYNEINLVGLALKINSTLVIDISGNFVGSGTVDGVDVSALNTNATNHMATSTAHNVTGSVMGTNMTNTIGSAGIINLLTNSGKLLLRSTGTKSGSTGELFFLNTGSWRGLVYFDGGNYWQMEGSIL